MTIALEFTSRHGRRAVPMALALALVGGAACDHEPIDGLDELDADTDDEGDDLGNDPRAKALLGGDTIESSAGVPLPPAGCVDGGSPLVWPLSGSTSHDAVEDMFQDVYGPAFRNGEYELHSGVDFDRDTGTEVRAVADGWVARIGVYCADPDDALPGHCEGTKPHDTSEGYPRSGNWILVRHWLTGDDGNQLSSRYLHLSDFAPGLAEGDCVSAGQVIGLVGDTGLDIKTEHLHFEAVSQPEGATPIPEDENLTSPYVLLPSVAGALPYEADYLSTDVLWHDVYVAADARQAEIGRIALTDTVNLATFTLPDLLFDEGGLAGRCGKPVCMDDHWRIDPVDFDSGDAKGQWHIKVPASRINSGMLRVFDIHGVERASTVFGGECGDGSLDPLRGEVCDDGNASNGDGCSTTCQFETPPTPSLTIDFLGCQSYAPRFLVTWSRSSGLVPDTFDVDFRPSGSGSFQSFHDGPGNDSTIYSGQSNKSDTWRVRACLGGLCSSFRQKSTGSHYCPPPGGGGGGGEPL